MLPRWFIKFGFHLLYYQFSWSYEAVAWLVSLGQWADWRRLALRYLHPGPTLELAYGTGRLQADLHRAGHRPAGIDLSPYMARQAGHWLARQSIQPTLCRSQAQTLPFATGCFVNVIATFPTDYIMESETLAEVYRVLQPNGQLIVVAQGILRGPWPVRPFIDWLYKITDQRSIPPQKPLNLLSAQGFTAQWKTANHNNARARLLIAAKKPPI
jgi:ubiquinone/menaquinone biosynthesis C-methylase UbiE